MKSFIDMELFWRISYRSYVSCRDLVPQIALSNSIEGSFITGYFKTCIIMGLISCFNVIFCPPRLFDDLLGHLEAIMVSLTKNKGWVTLRTWLSFELQQI